jgi:hypothetical protein
MDEFPVWMLTTALSVAILAIPTLFIRVMRSEIGGLRGVTEANFASVRSEISGLRAETETNFTSVRSEISGLRAETDANFTSVRSEVSGLRAETEAGLESVRSEVRRVEEVLTAQYNHLDRDVQAIARKVFGDDAA